MALFDPPYYPIIYVRGYASSQSEIEDTVADPYMGFNIGSSKIRQLWDSKVVRHYFESPIVRLMKDYGYRDVYHAGASMPLGFDVPTRSIFIYRYYEQTSSELGDGKRLSIKEAAAGLGGLILRIRDRLCSSVEERKDFRVYLVAHSMGGLVCRCLLQNDTLGNPSNGQDLKQARTAVDKLFTYATPHNGIDVNLIGNVPELFSFSDANNFNRSRIGKYLLLNPKRNSDDVRSLEGKFDPNRVFCLVGTNDRDYEAGNGTVRKAVGPMSDGLVRIENATTWGPWVRGNEITDINSPRAFVHRSHSGQYGIVNSEEGFQNLVRFLFGDIRVDGVLRVDEITLPPKLQKAKDEGKEIRASYHFETILRVRGMLWDLHRRVLSEHSAVFRMYDELFPKGNVAPRHPQLFSVFLSKAARVNKNRQTLGFSLDFGVLVPQYEVEGRFWSEDHYEGGYLFRDKINFEATPPKGESSEWTLRFGLDSSTPNRALKEATAEPKGQGVEFHIPIEQASRPGIRATLVLNATPWNRTNNEGGTRKVTVEEPIARA